MSVDETTDQADLDQFKTALEIRDEPADEKPKWNPQPDSEPDTNARVPCENCNETVSKQFARVFGDNDDRVIHGCPSCSTYREISGRENSYGTGSGVGGEGW